MGEARSDYERACDQMDYLGVITCASSQAIILGDEPLQSAFVVNDSGLIIVRWISCISPECASSSIARLPAELQTIEESKKFHLIEPCLMMFDSALDGANVDDFLRVDLMPGLFSVTTEEYKGDRDFQFLIHRLIRDKGFEGQVLSLNSQA